MDFELRIKVHSTGYTHQELDDLRRALAAAVIERFTIAEIRAQILTNLERWERQGTWGTAYDEWRVIACDDSALRHALLGVDEDAIRLRHSGDATQHLDDHLPTLSAIYRPGGPAVGLFGAKYRQDRNATGVAS